MREINRQVVIFGNFKSIGFNILPKINNLISEYNLNVTAMPDYIQAQSINGIVPINQIQNFLPQIVTSTQMMPLLVNSKKDFSIFIGSNRIHVEQNDSTTEAYEEFLDSAIKIIATILKESKVTKINRLAVNGKLIIEDQKKINENFETIFKQSNLYDSSSDEYSFRVTTKEYSETLRSTVNKIIAFDRASEITNNSETKPIILISYDYNTIQNNNAEFEISDLSKLIKLAKEYKNQID